MGSNQYVTETGERRPNAPEGSANHFTTGKRDRMDSATKAKIRASFASDKLVMYLKGEIQLEPAQVTAAKALMDKGIPSLQAVEQTTISETESKSPEELESMVRALITANPELLAKLNLTAKPVLAASSEGKEAEAAVIPLSNAALRA